MEIESLVFFVSFLIILFLLSAILSKWDNMYMCLVVFCCIGFIIYSLVCISRDGLITTYDDKDYEVSAMAADLKLVPIFLEDDHETHQLIKKYEYYHLKGKEIKYEWIIVTQKDNEKQLAEQIPFEEKYKRQQSNDS